LVVIVTPAASVTFLTPEFNDFLYAPIGGDRSEIPLSVLSALSRLNVDPWKEAAELSELPKDTAAQRLASLLVRLPGGRWAPADSKAIAHRLIELLPRRRSFNAPLAEKAYGLRGMTGPTSTKLLICIALALALAALVITASREPATLDDRTNSDAPTSSAVSPPQTSR
jgi:hypothetical protein